MKYLLLLSTILFTFSLSAQNCDRALLVQTAGTFKPDAAYTGNDLKAEYLAKNKKVLSLISNMIKSKYSPMGVDASYHENYGNASQHWGPNHYSYSIIPLNYTCYNNKKETEGETSTYFSININIPEFEIYDTAVGDRLSLEGFNVITEMPVKENGCWYFKEKDVTLAFGIPGKSSAWLLTYDGKLPFAYVTKKEFLEKRKLELANQMSESATQSKEVLENNEIARKYKETELKNDPEKLKKYMKMEYLQVKERYEKLLTDNEKLYKPAFDKIDIQLKMPANELNQQAIVKNDPQDHLSYLFTDDNDPFGKVLIKPNPGYFNTKISKSAPQFIWIYIIGNHKEPIAAKFMTDIMKAVDFTLLLNMLGK